MTATATVTVHNAGTTTWNRPLGYSLGANNDSDPLANTRTQFSDDTTCVAPGADHTFTLTLLAPLGPGMVTTDWRMVRDGVEWFGAVATQDVLVMCPVQPVDAIDLTTVTVVNSPMDIAAWPVTETITQITMTPTGNDNGLAFKFTPEQAGRPAGEPPESWKWPTGNGTDNYQYTVWAVVNVNGTWVTSGFIQMWQGRASTGAPLLTDFATNWAYDGRWGALNGYQPTAGEEWGFFVSAGNARGVPDVSSVRERSNVVRVTLPAGDVGVFGF